MKKNTLFYTYILLVIVMFLLPFLSNPNYSILKHTTSELGAQETKNAWMMNMTFLYLGLSVLYEGLISYKPFKFQQVIIIIFSLSLIAVAIFNHRPISDIAYDLEEDEMHSFFASLTGFSFVLLAISNFWVIKDKFWKIVSLSSGFLASILSLFIFLFEDYSGLFQRLMFIISFLYLYFIFQHIMKENFK